jgi:hypothetical protein
MRETVRCLYCGEEIQTHWQIFKHITCRPPPQPEPAPEPEPDSDPELPAAPEPTPAPTTPEPDSKASAYYERQYRKYRHAVARTRWEIKRLSRSEG